jgi:CubicO group peptidase (beta-lactamase class C family)
MLVASKDKILDIEAVGYSDVERKTLMKADALFWIASMSKPVAATALMMLVDDGKVRLDDPVEKYLPDFRPKIVAVHHGEVRLERPRTPIRVRNLLNHTAALPFCSAIEVPTLDQFPLSVGVKSYALSPLLYEPGSDFTYSNAGINTIGRIIEVVSGQSYKDFLQARLFGPLGMKDTTCWPTKSQVKRLAKSYKAKDSSDGLEETTITQLHYPLSDHENRYPMPAGGLFSTANDLAKFSRMLLNGGTLDGTTYVTQKSIDDMVGESIPEQRVKKLSMAAMGQSGPYIPKNYGLGWFLYEGGVYGHVGAYATDLRVDPKNGIAIIWLVQHASFPGDGMKSREAFERAATEHFGQMTAHH